MKRQAVIRTRALFILASLGALAFAVPKTSGIAPTDERLDQVVRLEKSGHIEEAAALLSEMGDPVTPSDKQTLYYEHAMYQCGIGHPKDRIAAFEKGIQAVPASALAGEMHFQLATLWHGHHDYSRAATEYKDASHFANHNDAWTYQCLGDVLQKIGQLGAARQAWTTALTANDDAKTGARQVARHRLIHFSHGNTL